MTQLTKEQIYKMQPEVEKILGRKIHGVKLTELVLLIENGIEKVK
tara:strand:+ start:3442 stop:3576 length:135 start_codon:yes stop_codon:yes gene_type:complete